MHELSLLQSALEIAEAHARASNASRIHTLTLRIGRLAAVEPEALDFAWEILSAGTLAEGGKLTAETVAVVCFCSSCQEEFAPQSDIFVCPRCERISSEVRRGNEMEVASLEVS